MNPERLALFTASLRIGGVQRSVLNLSAEFARRGYAVDVVLAEADGPLLEQVHTGVRVVDLRSRRVLASLPHLVRYLRRERPSAMLTLQTHCNIVGVMAVALASRRLRPFASEQRPVGIRRGGNNRNSPDKPRLIVSEHNSLVTRISGRMSKEAILLRLTPFLYQRAQGIVAVSNGLADELRVLLARCPERIQVIFNAVVTDELLSMAEGPNDHPWFSPQQPPVILSVGRLVPQKDHVTLLRAFARLRQNRNARLLVLGDGPERDGLEMLARQLGIGSDFSLPGFDVNPFRFMRHCRVFALTSAWEGLANVLVEAMACGAPVVSTDCRSGPAEILEHGKYGPLVPVGDHEALASVIEKMLDSPTPAEILRARASDFSVERSADEYLRVLLPEPE